jgi:HEAT repeat protein
MSDNGRNELHMTPEGRVAYLEMLLARDEPWATFGPVFVEFLDDEDPMVRAAAVRGLWFASDPVFVDRLLDIATNDPSVAVRAQAIGSLGIYMYEGLMAFDEDEELFDEFPDEDQITEAQFQQVRDFLLAVYDDEDRTIEERGNAIGSLAFLFDPMIADLIEDAYNCSEKEMKISAIFAMGRNGLTRWNTILAQELYNADPDIRIEAIRAVGEIGPPELGKDLLRLTFSDDDDTRLEAIEALGQSGWEGAFERLEELTLDLDPEVAEVAQEALEEWLMWREVLEETDELDADEDLFSDMN